MSFAEMTYLTVAPAAWFLANVAGDTRVQVVPDLVTSTTSASEAADSIISREKVPLLGMAEPGSAESVRDESDVVTLLARVCSERAFTAVALGTERDPPVWSVVDDQGQSCATQEHPYCEAVDSLSCYEELPCVLVDSDHGAPFGIAGVLVGLGKFNGGRNPVPALRAAFGAS